MSCSWTRQLVKTSKRFLLVTSSSSRETLCQLHQLQEPFYLESHRKSISELARDIGYQVQERDVSVEELLEAEEVFCTGTVMVVKAVETVTFHDKKIKYRTGEEALSTKLHMMLTNIQMGVIEDKKGWIVEIDCCVGIDSLPDKIQGN